MEQPYCLQCEMFVDEAHTTCRVKYYYVWNGTSFEIVDSETIDESSYYCTECGGDIIFKEEIPKNQWKGKPK